MMHHFSNERQNEEDAKQVEGETITEDAEQQEGKYDDEEENQSSLAAIVLAESANEEEKEEAPAESSSLLGTSPNDQILQPSIFTMHARSLEEE